MAGQSDHRVPARRALRAGTAWTVVILALGVPQTAAGQLVTAGRSVPRVTYYAAIAELYSGQYRDAIRGFNSELAGAIKTPRRRWIDSICYHTMLGECYYHAGTYARALEHFDAAARLYLEYPEWMIRVQFPKVIRPATSRTRRAPPWGQSTRTFELGQFPDSMLLSQGRLNNADAVRQGGVVQPPTFISLNVHEIVRCTALALRRRGELLGPLAEHDRLSSDLVAALSRRPVPPNHWSEAWIELQLGMAYAAVGQSADAQRSLTRSLVVAGRFDHPLTSMALLELGRIATQSGDLDPALRFFAEASYSGFYFGNVGDIEEAFRRGQQVASIRSPDNDQPALPLAARWAQSERYRQLQGWLTLLAAENASSRGDAAKADGLLGELTGLISRRDMANGVLGAHRNYLEARVRTQRKQPKPATQALKAALAFQQSGSKWLFQIGLVDEGYAKGNIRSRAGMQLYEELLRDPEPQDWLTDPLEALSVLVLPHRRAYENWFDAALQRKEIDRALEISDRAKRQDFFQSLPMGGRLLALQWILEAPEERLDRDAVLQRQDLLVRYPRYRELSDAGRQIQHRLSQQRLFAGEGEDADRNRQAYEQWQSIVTEQQEILREIALGRGPSRLVFPPLRPAEQIRETLPDGHALLVFFAREERLDAMMFTRENYRAWSVRQPATLKKMVGDLLRDMGNYDASRPISVTSLTDVAWQASSASVVQHLLAGSGVDLADAIEELTIVPDGFVWYLPFESLVVGEGDRAAPLIYKTRMRYAPTAGLSVPAGRRNRGLGRLSVVVGKLFPSSPSTVAEAEFQRLGRMFPAVEAIRDSLPGPSSYVAPLMESLVVLQDIDARHPYDWSPFPLDRTGSVGQWMALPWGGPESLLLPGFQTVAGNAMKRRGSGADGSEMFLTLCGLMASGTRTVLLSRWRTGGATSLVLVREFLQELPHGTASEAWQRSVRLAAVEPIDPLREPRVRPGDEIENPSAAHPFFWTGFLLVDTGQVPEPPSDDPPGIAGQPLRTPGR